MSDNDFDIEVRKRDDHYEFQVDSPGGKKPPIPATDFPYSGPDLKLKLTQLELALSRSSGMLHRGATADEQEAQDFGRDLFAWLMQGDVRSLYASSVALAGSKDLPLRVRIVTDVPAIAALPWEFLWDPDNRQYVVLSAHTPVIRYPELGKAIETLAVTPPLRILGMTAQPRDMPALNAEGERARIEKATRALKDQGLLEITWLDGATWSDLQAAILDIKPHIFHFVGHGGYDPGNKEGFLCFVGDDGLRDDKSGSQLNLLLQDARTLRLVILNACEGANGSDHDVFSSTAANLIQAGIPAVIAMQYAITDGAAIQFSQSFYQALCKGLAVDAAVAEGRKGIALKYDNSLEWATPVLYMRSPDGVLFDIKPLPAGSGKRPPPWWTRLRDWREIPSVVWLAIAATVGVLVTALGFVLIGGLWPPPGETTAPGSGAAVMSPGSPGPSQAPAPSPTLNPADVALAATLPVSVTGNCWHHNPGGGAESTDQVASIRCGGTSPIQYVTFQTYRNADALTGRWQNAMGAIHPAGTADACWDGTEGEAAWTGGRLQCDLFREKSCASRAGDAEVRWTNDAKNLYGAIAGARQTSSVESVRRWWQAILEPNAEPAPMTGPPNASACAAPSPGPTASGPTLPPSPSVTATPVPPTSTPTASLPPTATPPASQATGTTLTPEEQALKDMIPEGTRDTCASHDFPGGEVTGYVAGLRCDVGSDGVEFVKYASYATKGELDGQWARNLTQRGFTPDSSDCSNDTPGESSWDYGRVECDKKGGVWLVRWSDDPSLTFSLVRGSDGTSLGDLFSWVEFSGLISP